MPSIKLAIVMPAYNEQGCIEQVVSKWTSLFKEQSLGPDEAQLIVVNDGSRDKTGALLDALTAKNPYLKPHHQANAGHGKALLTAYRIASDMQAEWVFHVDSDDQFATSDFVALWAQRNRSNFILGHRRTRHDALHRLVITRIVRSLNFLLFGVWIPDANIPYRLIEGNFLTALLTALPQNVFAPNIFLAVTAARMGQDLINVPVHHEERKTGTVSILRLNLLKVCFRSAKELLSFRRELPQIVSRIQASSRAPSRTIKKAV